MVRRFLIKRIFDIIISFLALIVLMPIFVVLAIIVYLNLGSPIFFTQQRPGRNGRIFKMIKFRSMLNTKDSNGNLLLGECRLTNFGKLLRSTSLDELPEIINVIKGDMSLVGPRPLLVQYLPLYNQHQSKRHLVCPGITGWAQVNGRNTISWNKKFEYDVWYVENWSIFLDLKILIMTIKKVFLKDGVNQSNDTTMDFFNGTN